MQGPTRQWVSGAWLLCGPIGYPFIPGCAVVGYNKHPSSNSTQLYAGSRLCVAIQRPRCCLQCVVGIVWPEAGESCMHCLPPSLMIALALGRAHCADRSGGNSGASSEQSTPVLPLKPALHRRPTSSGEGAASAPRGGGVSSQGGLSYRFGGSFEGWDWFLVLARTDAGSSQSAGVVSVCVSLPILSVLC